MRRWLLASVSAGLLAAGCASPGQHAGRSPSSLDRLRLAAAAEANNNVEVALAIYRNAAEADPDNAEVQARYARALATQGAQAEAAVVLEQALARKPQDRTLLLALGRTQLRAGALRPASQSFGRLLEVAPGDPDALNGLGVIADLSGDHRLAQERYHEGLKRSPRHEGLRNNLALSMAMSGATAEAMQELQALRREGNVDVRVRHNLALVSAIAGDAATARQLSGTELDSGEQQRFISAAALLGTPDQAPPPAAAPAVRQVRAEPSPLPAVAGPAAQRPRPEAAPPAEGSTRVLLRARAETWVEVRERGSGTVLFDRIMGAGESWRVPDRAGLLLTAGNAAGLEVVVDGDTLPPLGGEGRVRRDLPLDPASLRLAASGGSRAETTEARDPAQHAHGGEAPQIARTVAGAPAPTVATASAAAAGRMLLRARAETWVEVRERGSGTVLFDRVMAAGETWSVPDRAGLVLTAGNAGGLEVVVDGETLPPLGAERAVRRNLPLDPATLRQAVATPTVRPMPAPDATPAEAPQHAVRPARIVLRATGDAWVQVRERDSGAVLFDRVLRAGESYPVPGRAGLVMTTGNAGGIEVVVDGNTLPPLGAERAVRRDVPLDPAMLRQVVAARTG